MCQLDLLSQKYYKILHVETRGITKALIAAQISITPKLALIVLAALAEKILKMVDDDAAADARTDAISVNLIPGNTKYVTEPLKKSKRKAINRNWYNQKANPALNTKAGNK